MKITKRARPQDDRWRTKQKDDLQGSKITSDLHKIRQRYCDWELSRNK